MTAEAPGYNSTITDIFNVAVSARQRVDLTLQVGANTDSITVSGAAAVVESDTTDKGQVINVARSPASYQSDVRTRLEFQAECFNLLNKTNFQAPAANRSNSNYGTFTSAFAARVLQFALRLRF